MRKVNLFYYSMTGQCDTVARAIAARLAASCEVTLVRVSPGEPRWQLKAPMVPLWRTFLATFLPTFFGKKIAITTTPAAWPASDAVIVGSATWWDRPALPIQALLALPEFRQHVRGKPVGLFAGCRGAFKNNLRICERKLRDAGAFLVARERFTFTGTLLGTFAAFFAYLRRGADPGYGFTAETLARSVGFSERFANASWRAADHAPAREPAEKLLRLLLLGLAVFDLVLGAAFIFFGKSSVGLAAPETYADPVFFQRCVGLFLLQYVYVQYRASTDPRAFATCLNMTVLVRSTFPILYLTQSLVLWKGEWTLLHTAFVASAVLDLAASAFILIVMKRLGIAFFQGDARDPDEPTPSGFLRWMLLVLALAEFAIAWNWLLAPEFWCRTFDVVVTVDPFWTRATGLLLLNIAYIQFLGFRDPRKYRTAAITSGIFRALWPILYWVTVSSGEGNGLFRASILFFSFFDLISCITIFALLNRTPPIRETGAALGRGEGAI